MVDRTSFEEINDGDYLKEGYYNGIYSTAGLKMDSSTVDTTAYTDSSNGWVTKKTLTFTPTDANNIIMGIKLDADLSSAGSTGSMRLSIEAKTKTASGSDSDNTTISGSGTTNSGGTLVASTCWMLCTSGTIGTPSTNGGFLGGETSYDIEVQILSAGSNICTIDNIIVTVFYMEAVTITTSSAKFS